MRVCSDDSAPVAACGTEIGMLIRGRFDRIMVTLLPEENCACIRIACSSGVCCRPLTHPAEIASWGAVGEKGDAADALLDGQKGIKYSKADMVCPGRSSEACMTQGQAGSHCVFALRSCFGPWPTAGHAVSCCPMPDWCVRDISLQVSQSAPGTADVHTSRCRGMHDASLLWQPGQPGAGNLTRRNDHSVY